MKLTKKQRSREQKKTRKRYYSRKQVIEILEDIRYKANRGEFFFNNEDNNLEMYIENNL